jgi:DinB superfamily
MNRSLKLAAIFLALPCIAAAQAAAPAPAAAQAAPVANPLSQALRDTMVNSSKNMVGAAELMPPDKYDYKPTPGQISYAQLVLHVANSNTLLCSKISGQAPPKDEQLTEAAGKDKLVAAIKGSFDYCSQVLANVDDSGLGNMLTLFGTRTATKARTMMILAYDWADHYSAQAAYLRSVGILPPSAPQPKK